MGLIATVGSWFGTGKTPAQLEEENRQADERLAQLNRERDARKRAEIDAAEQMGLEAEADARRRELDAWNRQANAHLVSQRAATEEAAESIDEAADEGLAEGSRNISGAIGGVFGVVGKGIRGVLFGVPVWVWLVAGVVAFFYFGGAPILRAYLKKKTAS